MPHRLPEETKQAIRDHISSIRGERSHYSSNKSRRLYLPEALNQTKLYELFQAQHPDIKASAESYRKILVNEFNIAFGYPRSDTCSSCDEYQANIKLIDAQLKDKPLDNELLRKRADAETENNVHLARADTFYKRKRASRSKAQTDESHLSICMDYQKNLPAPNISTNDVYYRRQLTCISFNIHELGSGKSHFYVYDETLAKKGSDDVCSLLNQFINNEVTEQIKSLDIFCDSCAGQNKNFTVFRFLHHLVHVKKRFESVLVTFPIRGHSYMECDKAFSLVNQKVPAETPSDWWQEFRTCRKNPSPYHIIECNQEMFLNFTKYLQKLYVSSCPFPTRPVRELLFAVREPRFASVREAYSGAWRRHVITKKKGQSLLPRSVEKLYYQQIPLSAAKYTDIQHLTRFCGPEAKAFYARLQVRPQGDEPDDSE